MCLFIGPVANVSKTKILVAPLTGGTRQLIVYQNDVEGAARNAMVLPVPKGNVELLDFSSAYHGDIWNDCEVKAKEYASCRFEPRLDSGKKSRQRLFCQ